MRVLLVEDDALMRKMIVKTIQSRVPEIAFVECPSVPEAKEAYDDGERFDFAIIDFELIQGTGYDVVNHIRVEKGDKLLPIMMCTSHQDRKTVLKMLELGVNDYLAKPFQPKKILDKIARLVERGKRIRESIEKRKQNTAGAASPDAIAGPAEPVAQPETPQETAPASAATSADTADIPVAEGEKKPTKKNELPDGVIDDSDHDTVEYIDLKKTGDDDESHVELTDDMFLS